ncbi:MAG: lysophospholipase [Prevotellaceae bacterium]|jgi:pimeloyl-ACP methyl ester carboxylesterase|nr:lysophospholipase [Prevotellaceae bacterium]
MLSNLIGKHKLLTLLLSFCSLAMFAQQEQDFILQTATGNIFGTLSMPAVVPDCGIDLALLVAGSGATDRNCNQPPMLMTNAFKMLADSLLQHNIATLRFDKRGIGASAAALKSEADLRFEDYIDDVSRWVDTLAKDRNFSRIVVVGHSEGALIGLIATLKNKKIEKYVSIAGTALPADEILAEQLAAHPQIFETAKPLLDTLKMGKLLVNVPPTLYALFRPSVQPYMISWMKYNPQTEIAKLTVPALALQGTTDIQAPAKNADLLQVACPALEKVVIENMNHVMKTCTTTEMTAQMRTYTTPDLPLADGLIKAIVDFVRK